MSGAYPYDGAPGDGRGLREVAGRDGRAGRRARLLERAQVLRQLAEQRGRVGVLQAGADLPDRPPGRVRHAGPLRRRRQVAKALLRGTEGVDRGSWEQAVEQQELGDALRVEG